MKTVVFSPGMSVLVLCLALGLQDGCGDSGSAQGGGGENYPPSVVVTQLTGTSTGDIAIEYVLTDANSDLCSITVEYSADSGATYLAATEGFGGDGTTGLASSPAGTPGTFVWQSIADIGNTTLSTIRIRITPSDGTVAGGGEETVDFDVDNTGTNTAPEIIHGDAWGNYDGQITIEYYLRDAELDLCSIIVEYSEDSGSTYTTATRNVGSEGTTGLTSDFPGTSAHEYIWDSMADIGTTIQDDVMLRFKVFDGTQSGVSWESYPLSIRNFRSSVLIGTWDLQSFMINSVSQPFTSEGITFLANGSFTGTFVDIKTGGNSGTFSGTWVEERQYFFPESQMLRLVYNGTSDLPYSSEGQTLTSVPSFSTYTGDLKIDYAFPFSIVTETFVKQ